MKKRDYLVLGAIVAINCIFFYYITSSFEKIIVEKILKLFEITLQDIKIIKMEVKEKISVLYFTIIILSVLTVIILLNYLSMFRKIIAMIEMIKYRKLKEKEKTRIFPLVENIIQQINKIKNENLKFENLKIRIIDDEKINACTVENYIALTTGTLKKANDREIEAVLIHEFSHYVNKDVRFNMLVLGANVPVYLVIKVHNIMAVLMAIPLLSFILFIPFLFVKIIYFVFVKIILNTLLRMVMMKFSRDKEYRCDALAVELGYGQDLISLFNKFEENEEFTLTDFFYSTHPETKDRIERMNKILSFGMEEVVKEVKKNDLKKLGIVISSILIVFIVFLGVNNKFHNKVDKKLVTANEKQMLEKINQSKPLETNKVKNKKVIKDNNQIIKKEQNKIKYNIDDVYTYLLWQGYKGKDSIKDFKKNNNINPENNEINQKFLDKLYKKNKGN